MATDLQAEGVLHNVRLFLPSVPSELAWPQARADVPPASSVGFISDPILCSKFPQRRRRISQQKTARICLLLRRSDASPSFGKTLVLDCHGDASKREDGSATPLVSDDSENIIVAGQIFLVASCARELCCGRFSAVGAQRQASVSGSFAGSLCRLNLHCWRALCCPEPLVTLV